LLLEIGDSQSTEICNIKEFPAHKTHLAMYAMCVCIVRPQQWVQMQMGRPGPIRYRYLVAFRKGETKEKRRHATSDWTAGESVAVVIKPAHSDMFHVDNLFYVGK
jgi:hypothetical protein